MISFIEELKLRNELLFWFSVICFALTITFYILTTFTSVQVAGVNAWFKPFKFAISIGIYCSTMAWYCFYLPSFDNKLFAWITIFLFSFELIYITIQAARGQESHFNLTTKVYQTLFVGMALAALAITAYAVYIGFRFFQTDFPGLPSYYIWAIRLSICVFVLFSLQGLAMGSKQTHTIGTNMQTTFLPFFKWNMKEGDLRVAHFVGMHSLQVIPLLSFYLLKNTKAVIVLSGLYLLFAVFVLVQALRAKPFIKSKKSGYEIIG